MSAEQHSGSSASVKLGREAIGWFCLGVASILWAAVAFFLSYTPLNWNDVSILHYTISWSPYSYIGLLVVGVVSLCIGFPSFLRIYFEEEGKMDHYKRQAKISLAVGGISAAIAIVFALYLFIRGVIAPPIADPFVPLCLITVAICSLLNYARLIALGPPNESSTSVSRSQKGG